jgi:hypothetical protein
MNEVDSLRAQNERLEKQVEAANEQVERFRTQVGNLQRAMKKMLPFLNVPESSVVTEGIFDIVEKGWATVDWTEGYTLLHYVCEHSHDDRVVDLVASLCVDSMGTSRFDARDADGHRAGDYAAANSDPNIAKVMGEYSQSIFSHAEKPKEEPYLAPKEAVSNQLTAIKKDLAQRDETMKAEFKRTGIYQRSRGENLFTSSSPLLNNELLLKYWHYAITGQTKLMVTEMQRSVATGGLGLSAQEARITASRLELLARTVLGKPKEDELEEDDAGDGKGKKGKGKGKGKGPGAPPAKSGKIQPTRAPVKPTVPMKPCRWEWGRYIFGLDPLENKDKKDTVWTVINSAFPEVIDNSVTGQPPAVE